MARRHPLEVLRSLRREQQDGRARALAERSALTQRAEVLGRRLRDTLDDAAAGDRRTLEQERGRLQRGVARAADLQQAAQWERGAASRQARAVLAQREAEERVRAARQAEAEARRALADAQAAAKLVEGRHRACQEERARSGRERADEAAADGWAARRRLRGDRSSGGAR